MLTEFRTISGAFFDGDVTVNGVISASCGSSEEWCSSTTVVQDNSGSWGTGGSFDPTELQAASGDWNSTYTTVLNESANWDSTYTTVSTESANWDSTYTTVSSNSASWDNGGALKVMSSHPGTQTASNGCWAIAFDYDSLVDSGLNVCGNTGTVDLNQPFTSSTLGVNAIDLQLLRDDNTYTAGANNSLLVGGENNKISNTASSVSDILGTMNMYTSIIGGKNNNIGGNAQAGTTYSQIIGGTNNQIGADDGFGTQAHTSYYSTILGGQFNRIGRTIGQNPGSSSYAVAAGLRAYVDHDNTFVWSDGNSDETIDGVNNTFISKNSHTFNIHADNGIRLVFNTTPQVGQVLTCIDTDGHAIWQNAPGGGGDYDDSALQAASGNWNSTYTTVSANSASWGAGGDPYDDTALQAASGNWNSTYTTVSANSASWGAGGTSTLSGVASVSDTTAKSLYTMSAGIPVEFESSDNNTLLYLDETNERVGVGTNTPQTTIDVVGRMRFQNTAASPPTTGKGFEAFYQDNGSLDRAVFIAVDRDTSPDEYKQLNFFGSEIRFVANDVLGAATDAEITRLAILSSGKIGMGTLEPTAQLHITGDGDGSGEFIKIESADSTGIPIAVYDTGTFVGSLEYNFAQNFFSLDVTNASNAKVTDAFVVKSESDDNFIGMGTQTPNERLTVAGNVSATGTVTADCGNSTEWCSTHSTVQSNSASWNAGGPGTSTLSGVAGVSDTTAKSLYTMTTDIPVEFESNDNNTLLYLDETSEKVGVGTNNPQSQFHIAGNSEPEFIIDALAGAPDLNFAVVGDIKTKVFYDTTNNGLNFGVDDSNVGVGFAGFADLFIQDGGNVGVGTPTPSGKLHIAGPGTGGKEFIKIDTTTSNGRPITFYDNGTFVGGIDYNFSGNYFSFDVTDAGLARVQDAFIIQSASNDNFIGMGTLTPNERLTVAGNVSATGTVTADCGNSTEWCSTHSTVQSNSASWGGGDYDDSALQAASGNWNSTYTTVLVESADWESTYTTVLNESANWIGGDYDDSWLSVLSGGWESTYTTVSANSASWGVAGSGDFCSTTVLLNEVSACGGEMSVDGTLSASDMITTTLTADGVYFNTGANRPPELGELVWDGDERTLDLGLDNGVVLQIGEEQIINVKAVENILNGQVVYASGAVGEASGKIEVSLYSASSAEGVDPGATDELFFVGIATQDIALNGFGYITTFGKVRDVVVEEGGVIDRNIVGPENTDVSSSDPGWEPGTVLYISTSAGRLTNTKPVSPNKIIPTAMIVGVNGNQRTLFVRQEHGYHIDELHDVRVINPQQSDVLAFNSTLSSWDNVTSNNWESTFTTVSTNSADWVTYSTNDISVANWVLDEDNLISDDDTKVPTQQSVKFYVDNVVTGINNLKGGYKADTDTPAISAGVGVLQGDTYYITASGTFYDQQVDNGDLIIATINGADEVTEWVIVNRNIQDELIDRWNSTYTSVSANSANWDSTYTTVSSNSAAWGIDTIYDDSALQAASGNWDSTYTTVLNESASWIGGDYDDSALQAASANWNSTYTTVSTESANWESTYTTVSSNSANWDSTYSTVSSVSASWYGSTKVMASHQLANGANGCVAIAFDYDSLSSAIPGLCPGSNVFDLDNPASTSNLGGGAIDLQIYRSSATNVAGGNHSCILGGTYNTISDSVNNPVLDDFGTETWYSSIIGGHECTIGSNNNTGGGGANTGYSSIIGGRNHHIGVSTTAGAQANLSQYGVIVGGEGNKIGITSGTLGANESSYCFAAGLRACADHNNAFVWSDGNSDETIDGVNNTFISKNSHTFNIHADNGIRLVFDSAPQAGQVLTCIDAEGHGKWQTLPTADALTILETSSGNWNSTYTTVSSNSATWGTGYDDTWLSTASADWESTYTTVSANSATWSDNSLNNVTTVTSNTYTQTTDTTHTIYNDDDAGVTSDIVATLMAPADHTGTTVHKKVGSSHNVVITPPSGLIDGAASFTLQFKNESVSIFSDGTNFFIA